MWRRHSESYLEASDCDLHESKKLVFSTLEGAVMSQAELGRNSHHTLVLSPWASYLAFLSFFLICNAEKDDVSPFELF